MSQVILSGFANRCAICEAGAVQEHHIVRRSQGGISAPTVYLCQTCHDNITAERWQMWLDEAGIWMVEAKTGEIVWRRLLGVDPGEAFDSLHLAREALEGIPQFVPFMDNTQLATLFRELSDVGKRGWAAQCAIVYEALSFRFVYGTKVERAKALASILGVSVPMLYDYAGCWGIFRERLPELVEAFDGKTSYLITAARSDEPDEWIDHALEEYQAGNYPVAKLRAEIKGEEYKPRLCPWLAEDQTTCERYIPLDK